MTRALATQSGLESQLQKSEVECGSERRQKENALHERDASAKACAAMEKESKELRETHEDICVRYKACQLRLGEEQVRLSTTINEYRALVKVRTNLNSQGSQYAPRGKHSPRRHTF